MAYNSQKYKQSKRGTAYDKEDDYVYPTKKVREKKTRNRKYDKNLIKAGLIDHANKDFDDFDDCINELADDYNPEEQANVNDYNKMLAEDKQERYYFEDSYELHYINEDY